MSSIVVVLSLFAFTLAIAPAAQAAYPEPDKVIEFLHHSSPGGAAGLFVLTSGDILNKTGIVKAKIQTQTRQGGSSAVALNYLKSKKGDPYVVMHWTTAQLMAMLRGTTQMKLDECVWLSTLIEDGNVLIVPYNSPYKTLKDLIADAKANPKKVSVGINSIGGSEHVMAARIERAAGVKFNITAFEFSPTQLIGGHIAMAFGNTAETSSHVKAKRARVLANMGERRVPYYKDIPTMNEQGVNASFTQVRGFFGGPNYPDRGVQVLAGCLREADEDQGVWRIHEEVRRRPALQERRGDQGVPRGLRQGTSGRPQVHGCEIAVQTGRPPLQEGYEKSGSHLRGDRAGAQPLGYLESTKFDYMTKFTPGSGFHALLGGGHPGAPFVLSDLRHASGANRASKDDEEAPSRKACPLSASASSC